MMRLKRRSILYLIAITVILTIGGCASIPALWDNSSLQYVDPSLAEDAISLGGLKVLPTFSRPDLKSYASQLHSLLIDSLQQSRPEIKLYSSDLDRRYQKLEADSLIHKFQGAHLTDQQPEGFIIPRLGELSESRYLLILFVERFGEMAPGAETVTSPNGVEVSVWKALTVVAQIWDTRTGEIVWARLCQSVLTVLHGPAPDENFISFLVRDLVAALP